ncbi:MAG TPA: DNA polymerase I [Tepidisphaeraceae bacterium]|jgi:DNA polymerase-1|nr:DNA polymerase I [Tepidisphaeraceae bacterium]
MPKSKSFYIIDGHAQIFRAFFAPFRDLTSPTGEPTKATFVFVQMLLNLVQHRKPDYLCMVIDSGDETVFRRDIYPEYKANRTAPPPEFEPQEERIIQIVRDAGVPIFVKPGFEADDLIATMAHRLCDADFEVFMVSKDKDLRQILTSCTHMYDVQADEVIDEAKMAEKYGYTPAEAIEVQTLMGDNTDNVPGIPGVGEKTAVKLVKKYGSADEILKHLDELTPKMRENFEQHGKVLPMTRQLVTLKTDVDFEFDPELCKFIGLNREVLKKSFTELGFSGLLKRFGLEGGEVKEDAKPQASKAALPKRFDEGLFANIGAAETETPEAPTLCTGDECDYRLIDNDQAFEQFLKELKQQKRFAFDTETTSLEAVSAQLVGMSFSWKEGQGFYVPVKGPAGCQTLECDKVLAALKPILENPKIEKVGHNIKYDLIVMRAAGIEVKGVVVDSMIAGFLLDASRMAYGIDGLARDLLNFKKIATDELIGKGRAQITMDRVELARIARYAAEDADIAFRLADRFDKQLDEIPALRKLNDDLETPLIDVLVEMETNGVAIDQNMLKEQSVVLGDRVEILRAQIHEQVGFEFNIDSPKQLADVLFNKLNLPTQKRTKTGHSTDVEVLERLSLKHPVPKLILEYRSLVKLKNTYLDNLTQYVSEKTGRVHGSFNQTGAITGRLSMSDPNLQNIPIRTDEGRRIRLAFVAGKPDHVLMTADYSQIELRVLAHFTEEPALMKAFEQDEDIHRAVAAEVFNVAPDQVTRDQRGHAKTINFGIVYGVTAQGLARRIEGLNVKSAQELINAYNKRFPSIATFLQKCVMDAQAHGYVETILGRRRPVTDINSGVLSVRNGAERAAINGVVQGSAADLFKIAMNRVYKRLKADNRYSKMLLQVHDELVFETPVEAVEADAAIIREEMTAAMKLKVPLKVEVGWGKNWGEGK